MHWSDVYWSTFETSEPLERGFALKTTQNHEAIQERNFVFLPSWPKTILLLRGYEKEGGAKKLASISPEFALRLISWMLGWWREAAVTQPTQQSKQQQNVTVLHDMMQMGIHIIHIQYKYRQSGLYASSRLLHLPGVSSQMLRSRNCLSCSIRAVPLTYTYRYKS